MSISKETVIMRTASDDVRKPHDRTTDDALSFLERHKDENSARLGFDKAYMARMRRRIDLRVIPFMFFCYLMNFLDKVLLNYSNVMGLTKDLHLKGNNFSNASSAFFIAVLIASMANTYLIQRFPTGKWLGINLFCWGIATACTAATKNYGGLLATRIFCGTFEAAIPPSLMLLCSQWYTRDEQSSRFSFWYLGIGFGQVLGGLISWAFQHVAPTAPLASWRIMFVCLGCTTLVIGTSIFFFLPDTPMQAWFLTDEEKVALLEHVKVNQTGIENRRFIPRQVLEALTDIQLWGLVLILLLQGTGGGVITSYSATLIKSFGYTPMRSALLNMGGGAVTIASTLFCGFGVRYFGNRWSFIVATTVPTIIGAALMTWEPHANKGGLLAGIYLVNTFIGSTPITYQWLTANVAGHTKRAFCSAFLNGAFAVGNIIGPQTFQAKDAPDYHPARVSMVATQSCALGVTMALLGYYVLMNKRRNARALSDGESISDEKAYAGLTDKQNDSFRYTY